MHYYNERYLTNNILVKMIPYGIFGILFNVATVSGFKLHPNPNHQHVWGKGYLEQSLRLDATNKKMAYSTSSFVQLGNSQGDFEVHWSANLKKLKNFTEGIVKTYNEGPDILLHNIHEQTSANLAYMRRTEIVNKTEIKDDSLNTEETLPEDINPLKLIFESQNVAIQGKEVNLTETFDIIRNNLTEYVEVSSNNKSGDIFTVYKNISKTIISVKKGSIGIYTLILDDSRDTIMAILNDGKQTVSGIVKNIEGVPSFQAEAINVTLGRAFSGRGLLNAEKQVTTVAETNQPASKKKSSEPRKGGDHTSFLGRCPGFIKVPLAILSPLNPFGGQIFYQGPIDNGLNSEDVDDCFVSLQNKFPLNWYNPLDYIWPQPRECLKNKVGICECSLDTVPPVQYVFQDDRTSLYDYAVSELRDLTQGYLPRKGVAYGTYLTASYSCAMDPDEPDFPEYELSGFKYLWKIDNLDIDPAEEP